MNNSTAICSTMFCRIYLPRVLRICNGGFSIVKRGDIHPPFSQKLYSIILDLQDLNTEILLNPDTLTSQHYVSSR